ncbi:hypothetical protein RclHR1_06550009 [Rhizophagus clarus]|uniref:F-box domain-containing protein n=1 Tax=Rhizophagus clarus TaxID=94130 RepID=A0A2Z6S5D3_9GLOM|nr:hypothetical protein RclHR1_06550009 [Rhizophagus clarus]GET04686.1 hypothetical protein GLOIN_2v1772503 [Rhizophagus clarus]
MSKLNGDVLLYIFQHLHDLININSNNKKNYKNSLHSCLFVNKLWCEIMIPVLWSYPHNYVYKKNLLLNIIISHLSNNSIKFLKDENIIEKNFQKQKLSFNYIRFCKYLNNIHYIFPNYKQRLRKEIYKLFIRECSSIKCLSYDMLDYSICEFPNANVSLSNLSELDCTEEQYSYYKLAQICRSIEKIKFKINENELSRVAKLIEMQKQIKYIFIEEYVECERFAHVLEKQANSIIYLNLRTFVHSLLYTLLPKLINLQFLRIHMEGKQSEKFKECIMNAGYYKLQILELQKISLELAINIIQNTNGNLWKIKIRLANCNKAKEYNQTIYKYCPNIKYVTVFLNRIETLEELENIFIKCQHLKAIDIDESILKEYCDNFLELIIKSAPLSLYKIHLYYENQFSEKTLNLFFSSWGGENKKTLHLYSRCSNWVRFTKKYKGVVEYDYYKDDFWNHEITWN